MRSDCSNSQSHTKVMKTLDASLPPFQVTLALQEARVLPQAA